MLRRGYGKVQGDEDDEAVCARRPIPAYVLCSILSLAHSASSPSVRRAATASVLCYVIMLRARARALSLSLSLSLFAPPPLSLLMECPAGVFVCVQLLVRQERLQRFSQV
jgi:hypothetical protein